MFTTLPLRARKNLSTVPPEMFTSLPLLASKELPIAPPKMFTTLPPLASKALPTVPPEMLTSTFSLVPKDDPALKLLTITPASNRFSCVSFPMEDGAKSGGTLIMVVN